MATKKKVSKKVLFSIMAQVLFTVATLTHWRSTSLSKFCWRNWKLVGLSRPFSTWRLKVMTTFASSAATFSVMLSKICQHTLTWCAYVVLRKSPCSFRSSSSTKKRLLVLSRVAFWTLCVPRLNWPLLITLSMSSAAMPNGIFSKHSCALPSSLSSASANFPNTLSNKFR